MSEHENAGFTFNSVIEDDGIVLAFIPSIAKKALELKIHGIDQGGIWIETQKLTDDVLELFDAASLPATPIFFIPYSAIVWACALAKGPSLSSAKLGL